MSCFIWGHSFLVFSKSDLLFKLKEVKDNEDAICIRFRWNAF